MNFQFYGKLVFNEKDRLQVCPSFFHRQTHASKQACTENHFGQEHNIAHFLSSRKVNFLHTCPLNISHVMKENNLLFREYIFPLLGPQRKIQIHNKSRKSQLRCSRLDCIDK